MCVPMREYQNGHTHLYSAQVVSKEEKSCVRVNVCARDFACLHILCRGSRDLLVSFISSVK